MSQTRKILRLEATQAIPAELLGRLESSRHLFERERFVENILREPVIADAVEELERYLALQWIHAYHCTKERHPGFFQSSGLRPTDVAQHQQEFLRDFGYLFTTDEVACLVSQWHDYFVREGQASLRQGRIWACLSRSLVKGPGTKDFVRLYGGEAVSMPFDSHPTIAPKLEQIGRPVVVEVAVLGGNLKAMYPMSTALLSQHHQTIRGDAHPFKSEAVWRQPVPPGDVIAVTPLSDFSIEG